MNRTMRKQCHSKAYIFVFSGKARCKLYVEHKDSGSCTICNSNVHFDNDSNCSNC